MQWTVEQRTVLHLLRTETTYDHGAVAGIFNHLFAKELREAGYTNGLATYRVRDEYNSRSSSGRSKVWQSICSKQQNAQETQHRQSLLTRINETTNALNFVPSNNGSVPKSIHKSDRKKLPNLSAFPSALQTSTKSDIVQRDETPFKQPHNNNEALNASNNTNLSNIVKQNHETKTNRHDKDIIGLPSTTNKSRNSRLSRLREDRQLRPTSQAARSIGMNDKSGIGNIQSNAVSTKHGQVGDDTSEGDTVRSPAHQDGSTTTQQSSMPSTGPPLEMIHRFATTTTWNGNTPKSLSSAFLDHKDEVYWLGGMIFRGNIDGEQPDVMLCNKNYCAPCKLGKTDGRTVIVGQSKTGGLPFVHARDLDVPKLGAGFHFLPKTGEYTTDYPERMWKTKVAFWDGEKREVMVCEAAKCVHCSGAEAVAKKAARYESGGDLYKLKKMQKQKAKK